MYNDGLDNQEKPNSDLKLILKDIRNTKIMNIQNITTTKTRWIENERNKRRLTLLMWCYMQLFIWNKFKTCPYNSWHVHESKNLLLNVILSNITVSLLRTANLQLGYKVNGCWYNIGMSVKTKKKINKSIKTMISKKKQAMSAAFVALYIYSLVAIHITLKLSMASNWVSNIFR